MAALQPTAVNKPTFLGLPNEMLLNIVENLQCEDIESVTLSCKHIQKLASKILSRHLSRKRRFTTVAIGQIQNSTWDEDAQIRGIHPVVALQDFILDEKSALYPRTLIVGYIEKDMADEDDLDPEEGQIADSDLAKIVAQLGDRLLPKVLEVTRALQLDTGGRWTWVPGWASRFVSGDPEAAACLLIALLPNLEKLRIVDDWRYHESPPFYSTLDRLLEAATDSKYDLTGLNSFKYLSEVGLLGGDDRDGGEFAVGLIFSALPSIRTIKGRFLIGEPETPGLVYKPVIPIRPKSEITKLQFHQSSIETGSFLKCMASIKALQQFTYDFCADIDELEGAWEPRGIVEVLQAFASRSLVYLELTGVTTIYTVKFRRGEPYIWSLRNFEVLEILRLETVMLFMEVEGTDDRTPDEKSERYQHGPPEITGHDWAGGRNALVEPVGLVDVLPASAKRLRLVGELSNEEAMAMLEDIVELKVERIPNLRRIFFEDVDPSSEILTTCEEANVKVRFCARV